MDTALNDVPIYSPAFKRKPDLYSTPLWEAHLWSTQHTVFYAAKYTTPAFTS